MKNIKLFMGDKALLAAAAVLLLVLAGQQVMTRAARAEVSSVEREIAGIRREMEAVGGIADVEALRKTAEEEKKKAVAFPSELEGAGTVNAIWTWAEGAGVQLDLVGYNLSGDVVEGWRYPAHVFNLSGRGKSGQIAAFLQAMEKSGIKTLTVGNVAVSKPEGGLFHFSMVVKVWSAGRPG